MKHGLSFTQNGNTPGLWSGFGWWCGGDQPMRRFTQPDFQRIYVRGPAMGLNNMHSP